MCLCSEKDCPGVTLLNSNVTDEVGHVYGDSLFVQCGVGFVKDNGNNNLTSYDIICGADANWDDTRACISKLYTLSRTLIVD